MFRAPRRLPAALLLLLLVAGLHEVRAQSTGFLLGLRYDAEIDRPLPYYAGDADSLKQAAYYTLYVTRVGHNVQVAFRSDDLLIPRQNGFVAAGSKRSVYNNWVEDFVWTASPGERPEVPGIQAFNGENCQGHREQILLFAGSEYLSLRQKTAGYCEGAPHPWYFDNLAVVPIDSVDHTGLDIDAVLGQRARRSFETMAAELIARESDDDAFVSPPDPANWGIVRQNGQWVAIGRVDLSDQIAVADQHDLVVSTDLPRRLVERNERAVPPQIVRRVAPDAVDYFTSPLRDFIVIMRRGRFSVHPLQGQTIGRRLLEVSTREGATPVVARWSSGERVEQWLKQLESPRISAQTRTP